MGKHEYVAVDAARLDGLAADHVIAEAGRDSTDRSAKM
jgi:hypothetical protein